MAAITFIIIVQNLKTTSTASRYTTDDERKKPNKQSTGIIETRGRAAMRWPTNRGMI